MFDRPENELNRRAQFVLLGTVSAWMIGTCVYGFATVAQKLALPPSGDTYTNSTSFQVFQFVAFKVPSLVVLLVVVLTAELFVVWMPQSSLPPTGKRQVQWTILGLSSAIVTFGVIAAIIGFGPGEYNPYFHPVEQKLLTFAKARLPILAALGGLLVWAQYRFAARRAR